MSTNNWSHDELILAFNLYCRTPFGRLHRSNPDIVMLSKAIGRTPSAVAMKCCNFASLDPVQKARNIKGLGNAGPATEQVWNEFHGNWEKLAAESQEAMESLKIKTTELAEFTIPSGPSEKESLVRIRRVQGFFRNAVLTSYKFTCAICELSISQMLCASHIIPWSVNVERRADPTNGLSLCSFHDKAFDRGLLTIDEKNNVCISKNMEVDNPSEMHKTGFILYHGRKIALPERFAPDPAALEYHRRNIFAG